MKRYLVLTVFLTGLLAQNAMAASLFGKVIEVNSGDVITIFNLNRPVRVRLLGVDAPEMDQAFGDVAKKHLSYLVLEKSVVVEYSGIAGDSSLNGRVLLNNADIGAQMIRDGAAWFDSNHGERLSAADRDVYQASEQAARSEKRGLWQADNPTAPWEHVKAEALKKNPAASFNAIASKAKARRNGPVPELTNLTLMIARMNPGASQPGEIDTAWARSSARRNWSRFQILGESFSILIPDDGVRETQRAPFADQTIDINSYTSRDGWAMYSIVWYKGPSYGETDQQALAGALKEYLTDTEDDYRGKCKPRGQKNVSQNGYAGTEFDLSSCSVPTRLRIYTKVVDNERKVYAGLVAYSRDEDENVARFLNSFTVGETQKSKSKNR